MIAAHFEDLLTGDFDLNTRQELLEASALGGMVISQTGTTVVHTMGYSFTYFKGTDHGRANGLTLGHFLKLGESVCPERIREITDCINMKSVSEFIDYLNRLLKPDESLTEDEINKYTEITMNLAAKKLGACMIQATEADIRDIYSKIK